ncbi:papain family cysteine protease (macronuclear) [Tetrahymena thermophila SB210]|uniref:Papain family cysteine protease n=1 Tax=Tetrahymena thermophila (strain SB210) TaxID=312017 RepID=Q23H15_TETTS|nr:papain family cysteine protease [Tetrahymena thermophila SB210]EAR95832.2 papain family cysteine protease [Tetrahymena thermophila SB210]|eukprot:XP_001016077.2 papain family cysteine protease [Tetrahymena thermophila SB210]
MTKVEFTEKILMKQDLVDHLMNGISQEATHNDVNNENQLNSKSLTLAASIDWREKGPVTSIVVHASFSAAGLMEPFNYALLYIYLQNMKRYQIHQFLYNVHSQLRGNSQQCKQRSLTEFKSPTLAASIDWRTKGAVTSVKNQGNCGSCWSFSAAGLMESFNFIQNKALVDFSEQQLLDCVIPANGYNIHGCEGWPAYCVEYASKVSITTLKNYPYVRVQNKCNVTGTNNGFKPKKWNQVPNTSNDLKSVLNFSPVSVLVDANNWDGYQSGIFNGCDQSLIILNHAVLAVGYDKQGNWIVKNSWGPYWGENGYMRLAPNNTCSILKYNIQITA